MTSSPSSFVDPSAPLRDYFAGISNKYSRLDLANQEAAAQAKREEESNRRFALQEGRALMGAQREEEKYRLGKAMQKFYQDFASNYNEDDVRTAKAKSIFNLTDEQLASDKGRELLDALPLYQEDIENYYGSQFTSRFGTAFDPTAVRSIYGDVSSLASLQEQENKRAELLSEANKDYRNFQLQALKALVPTSVRDTYDSEGNYLGTTASGSSSTSTKRKAPKAFSDVLVSGLVKEFEDNSSWNPLSSERQEAQNVGLTVLNMMQTGTLKGTPAEAERVIKTVLDRARTGGSLTRINDNPEEITALATAALNDIRQYDAGVKAQGVNPYRDRLGALAEGEGVGVYSPTDIRSTRRKAAFDRINQILGVTPAAPAALTTASAPSSNASSRAVLDEGQIISNVGMGQPSTSVSSNEGLLPTAAEEMNLSRELEAESKKEQPKVDRLAVLRNNVPVTVVRDQDLPALDALFSSNPSREILTSAAIDFGMSDTEMLDTFNQYDATIERAGGIGPTRQSRIDRYNEGKDLVDQVNKVYGEDGIKTDTLFVLPYDEKGKLKSWDEVVKDINTTRESIKFTDEIGRDEYEEAKNDPAKQQEIIDRVNRLIANDVRFRTASSRVLQESGDFLSRNVLEPVGEFFSGLMPGFDPTDPRYAQEDQLRAQQAAELQARLDALDTVDAFVNRQQNIDNIGEGNWTQMYNAYTGFAEDSPVAGLVNDAGKVTAAAYALPLRTAVTGGGRVLANTVNSRKAASVLPKPAPSTATVGPTRAQYYENLSRTPAVNRSDARRLSEWLEKNAQPTR